MPPDWLFVVTLVGGGLLWAFGKPFYDQRTKEREMGRELNDPFFAEVLYEGQVVADLSDREWVEMFWRSYRIEPRSVEAKEIIGNDALWEKGEFDFRNPATGEVCTSGFAGGEKPFVRDGRITLRALYFGDLSQQE